jgi:hypothetical protein
MRKKKLTLWTLSGWFNFSLAVNSIFQVVEEEHNILKDKNKWIKETNQIKQWKTIFEKPINL